MAHPPERSAPPGSTSIDDVGILHVSFMPRKSHTGSFLLFLFLNFFNICQMHNESSPVFQTLQNPGTVQDSRITLIIET